MIIFQIGTRLSPNGRRAYDGEKSQGPRAANVMDSEGLQHGISVGAVIGSYEVDDIREEVTVQLPEGGAPSRFGSAVIK